MTRDDAVVGEAAGLAMGLVMLGTHSPQAIEDMTNVGGVPLPWRRLWQPVECICLTFSMLETHNMKRFKEVYLWGLPW